jgi:NAD(P)H-dependent flavin oxidoreductase YrpB (nitropropane dioxygenase family)
VTVLRTPVCDLLEIEFPIFAFTHVREVVAAVSRAGGMGMYGAAYFEPAQVDADLAWIADNTDGRPFGVDVLIPASYEQTTDASLESMERELQARIPASHRAFVEAELMRLGVGEIPPGAARAPVFPLGTSAAAARLHLQSAMDHGASLLVSALGAPPIEAIDDAHDRGIRVGAMLGSPRHGNKMKDLDLDLIVAQGSEAAAHSGDISTMVLVPQIVEMFDLPVLAAGGIATGAQALAALALGAQGVWSGSVWRTAEENRDDPASVVERLLAASSADTVKSRCMTGKPLRQLRSPWNEAWEAEDAPPALPMPLQRMLIADAEQRFVHFERDDLIVSPIGQVVGQLHEIRPARSILEEIVSDCEAAAAKLGA